MHVKASLTAPPVEAEQLRRTCGRGPRSTTEAGSTVRHASSGAGVFRRFHQAPAAARDQGAGRHPPPVRPYVVCRGSALDYLRWAVEQLEGDRALVRSATELAGPGESRLDPGLPGGARRLARRRRRSPKPTPRTSSTVVAATSPLGYFQELIRRDLAIARRDQRMITLLLFEIVEFEAYRQTFGSKAADSCQRMIGAQIMRTLRRAGDLCARSRRLDTRRCGAWPSAERLPQARRPDHRERPQARPAQSARRARPPHHGSQRIDRLSGRPLRGCRGRRDACARRSARHSSAGAANGATAETAPA